MALAGCGSAGSTRPSASSPTTTVPPASTTTVASTVTSAPGLDFLTAWGATPDQWNANHTPDPGTPNDYWPKLPDGLDTYTNLVVTNGRVVGYVLNLYPGVAAADAKSRLANDLPLDATIASEHQLGGCDQLVEHSPTIDAVSPGGLLAELESAGGGAYSASSVARIVVSPLSAGSAAPATC